MGGLFGGGGGAPAGAGTAGQPQPNTAQIFQPPNQPGQANNYQNLVNQLASNAYSGLTGQVPSAQVYPQVVDIANAATTPGSVWGSYGPYGPQAVQSALNAAGDYSNLYYGSQLAPQALGETTAQTALNQLPNALAAFNNPSIGGAVQNIINNPYQWSSLGQLLNAQGLANQTVGSVSPGLNQLPGLASQLPAQGQAASQLTQGFIPSLAGLGAGEAAMAPQLSGAAQALSPQLQQLFQQAVPSLQQGASQYASQAGSFQPYLNQLIAGGTIPASQGLAQQGGALAPQYAQQLQQAYAPLASQATNILQQASDPNQDLYNRTARQLLDQQQAINAMSGVSTTPYGAGVTGNTMSNFNINWQNQELQRQIEGLQAAQGVTGMLPGFQQQALSGLSQAQGMQQAPANQALALAGQGLAGTQAGANILNQLTQGAGGLAQGLTNQQLNNLIGGGNLYSNLAAGAGGQYAGAANLANQALNQIISAGQGAGNLYGGALNLGAGGTQLLAGTAGLPQQQYNQQQQAALQALTQQAQLASGGLGAAGQFGGIVQPAGNQILQGLQAGAQFGQLPYQTATQQQQNALNALSQQMNIGQQQYVLPQQVLNDLQSYLQLGQAASGLSGTLGQLGTNQLQSGLFGAGALGSMASPLLFGNQGISGALGLGTGGLVGALTGGGGSASAAGLAGASPSLISDLLSAGTFGFL